MQKEEPNNPAAANPTETSPPPRFLENGVLLMAGLLAQAPLYYQLKRWASGLDPAFVHLRWWENSSSPFVLEMAAVHPLVWIALTVIIFIRICRNYGWSLEK